MVLECVSTEGLNTTLLKSPLKIRENLLTSITITASAIIRSHSDNYTNTMHTLPIAIALVVC